MRSIFVLLLAWLLSGAAFGQLSLRNDVLVIVNDNATDAAEIGNYYIQRRNINPANLVHVKVPSQAFSTWTEFKSLRDQILRFGLCRTLPPTTALPPACKDPALPIYTPDTVAAITAATPIRYIVMIRGLPLRMMVDGSNLAYPTEPTSVDNYLRFWLARHFTSDVLLNFQDRWNATQGGRIVRPVQPATDHEYVIGRIDGVNTAAAKALIDRALAAEQNGVYGKLYGHQSLDVPTYSATDDWRYFFGQFAETRPECADYAAPTHYLNFGQTDSRGKTPAQCQVKITKAVFGSSEVIPGHPSSRQALADSALVYEGHLDGQTVSGGIATLLNWRKNTSCTSTLCSKAADPETCRAASTDPWREIDTRCVGVADGFVGYNFQSYPVAYFGNWPTGWGPYSGGGGANDVPELDTTQGADDNRSLWFVRGNEAATSTCYTYSGDLLGATTAPCAGRHHIGLAQSRSTSAPDPTKPPTYRLQYHVRGQQLPSPLNLTTSVIFAYPKSGSSCPPSLTASGSECLLTIAAPAVTIPAGNTAWLPQTQTFTPPAVTGLNYTRVTVRWWAPATTGRLGLDAMSFKDTAVGTELLANGSFAEGYQQTGAGDYAANFLGRLGGTAFWGSLSHHESSGYSFSYRPGNTLQRFLQGLPLGDAVWLGENHNSGALFGDPLYSPVAVRINPLNNEDRLVVPTTITGYTLNGRDATRISTTYSVAWCKGADFYACDRAGSWQTLVATATGGGTAARALGTLNPASLPGYGPYTLRLLVTSSDRVTSRTQTFGDYYVFYNQYLPGELPSYRISGTVRTPDGRLLPQVSVKLQSPGIADQWAGSDTNGEYYFSKLPDGVYTLAAELPGYKITPADGNPQVTVSGKNLSGKALIAQPLGGRVVGRVTDSGGQPLAGMNAWLSPPAGGTPVTTLTNADGYFSLPYFSNGDWRVSAAGPSLTSTSRVLTLTGADQTANFTLTPQLSTVSGFVRDPVGTGIAGIPLQCQSNRLLTNSNGYYLCAGLGAQLDAINYTGAMFTLTGSTPMPVQTPATNVNFVARPIPGTYSVAGFVLRGSTPLPNVGVLLAAPDGTVTKAATGANGMFLLTGVSDGVYQLSVPPQGTTTFQPASRTVTVSGANVVGQNFGQSP